MISTLRFPMRSHIGLGSIEKLLPELRNWNVSKILIVTDRTLVKIGLVDQYLSHLNEKFAVNVYTEVEPEPSLNCAEKLVEYTRQGEFDCVIGLGGGSALDLAKLAAVISQNEGTVVDYLNLTGTKSLVHKGIPKILIPTTSGTGSEVTDIAVLSLKGTKDVVTHDFLLANLAIVDPQLTISVPARITAATGIDALTHAVEAYLSVNANEATDSLALKAVELISDSLKIVVENGEDIDARTAMSYGSYLAGLAFFNAGVAGVHALAYPLGSQFKLPHGESNAVLLPYVMNYITPSCSKKMNNVCNILTKQGAERTSDECLRIFYKLVEGVGLPSTLKEYGIPESKLGMLTEDAVKQTRLLARSPRTLKEEDIFQIYLQAFKGVKAGI
ncbi:iron-containing alcohol dehydrogenase [Paenibacillus sp. BSR1-1]|uniref:iron-containing alcohol dehydrogenase n=1 Tax=Paenibacillus sp. BSR1-1 TaxID=3020845 RepID=UPI0025B0EE8F|nr:iron-containing alcohol dehydrogenase [Paenibacillus sp. BSR1-1]MDN3016261.1 iron-containing alcohol dehydrogenase [Paenibacillus sp. BSR1-1]